MGCDIHLYIEVKNRNNKWVNKDKFIANEYYDDYPHEEVKYTQNREVYFYTGGRNYNLFAALCGVRKYVFGGDVPIISEPKGLPEDVSWVVKEISDIWGCDGHSHSWNTLEELKAFDWSPYGDTVKDFLEEVIPKMEAFGLGPKDVRIVYFFDN